MCYFQGGVNEQESLTVRMCLYWAEMSFYQQAPPVEERVSEDL
jgi:hypothetical protein